MVEFIEWKDEFSVGVEEIDKQHKGLVELINDLNSAMRKGQGHQIVGKIIEQLVSYTKYHFSTEEKYFKMFNYEFTEEHIKEHQEFVDKINKFKQEYAEGKLTLTLEVLEFLNGWIKHHILINDKKYSDLFVSKLSKSKN